MSAATFFIFRTQAVVWEVLVPFCLKEHRDAAFVALSLYYSGCLNSRPFITDVIETGHVIISNILYLIDIRSHSKVKSRSRILITERAFGRICENRLHPIFGRDNDKGQIINIKHIEI